MGKSLFIFEGRIKEIILPSPADEEIVVIWKRGSNSGEIPCRITGSRELKMPSRQDMKFSTNLEKEKTGKWKSKLLTLVLTKSLGRKEIGKTTIPIERFMKGSESRSIANVKDYVHMIDLGNATATLKIDFIMYPNVGRPSGLSLSHSREHREVPHNTGQNTATSSSSKDDEINRLRQQLTDAETNFTIRLSEMQSQSPPSVVPQQTTTSSDPETQKLVEDLQMHSLTLEHDKSSAERKANELQELVFSLQSELDCCKLRISELETELAITKIQGGSQNEGLPAPAASVQQHGQWTVDFTGGDSSTTTPWEKGFSDKDFNRQNSSVSSLRDETEQPAQPAGGQRPLFPQNENLFTAAANQNQTQEGEVQSDSLFPTAPSFTTPEGTARTVEAFPNLNASPTGAEGDSSLFQPQDASLFSSPPPTGSTAGFPAVSAGEQTTGGTDMFGSPNGDQQSNLFEAQAGFPQVSETPPAQTNQEPDSLFSASVPMQVGNQPVKDSSPGEGEHFFSPPPFESPPPQEEPTSQGGGFPAVENSEQQPAVESLFSNPPPGQDDHVWSPKSMDSNEGRGLSELVSSPIIETPSPPPVTSPPVVVNQVFLDPFIGSPQSGNTGSPKSTEREQQINLSTVGLWSSDISSTPDGKWLISSCDDNLSLISDDNITLTVSNSSYTNGETAGLDMGPVFGILELKLTAKTPITNIMARIMQAPHKQVGINQTERELIDLGGSESVLIEYQNTSNFTPNIEQGESSVAEFRLRVQKASVNRLRFDLRYQIGENPTELSTLLPVHPLKWASSTGDLLTNIVSDTMQFEKFALEQEITLPVLAISTENVSVNRSSFVDILRCLNFAATAFPDGKVLAATSFAPAQLLIARINISNPLSISVEIAGGTESLCKAVRHTLLCFFLP